VRLLLLLGALIVALPVGALIVWSILADALDAGRRRRRDAPALSRRAGAHRQLLALERLTAST